MPFPSCVRHAVALFLVGLALALGAVSATRAIQVTASPEAAWFTWACVVLCAGAGMALVRRPGSKGKPAGGRLEGAARGGLWGRVRGAVPLGVLALWMLVDPVVVARLAGFGGTAWGHEVGPPLLFALPFLLIGPWLHGLIRESKPPGVPPGPGDSTGDHPDTDAGRSILAAELVACLALGMAAGALSGVLVVLPSSLGGGGARGVAAACLILAAAVEAWMRSRRRVDVDRTSACDAEREWGGVARHGGRGALVVSLVLTGMAGLVMAGLWPELLRPLRGNVLAWPLILVPVLVGTVLGSLIAGWLGGRLGSARMVPAVPALLALGSALGWLACGLGVSDKSFDDLLARLVPLGWGGGDTSFLLAALFPSAPMILLGLACGWVVGGLAREQGLARAGQAVAVGAAAWIGGALVGEAGWVDPEAIAVLVTVVAGLLALAGTLAPGTRGSPDLLGSGDTGLAVRLLAGFVVVLAVVATFLGLSGRPEAGGAGDRKPRLLGDLEAVNDSAGRVRLVIGGSLVPAGPGAEERAVLSFLVQAIHGADSEQALVIEPGPSALAVSLRAQGISQTRVIDLVDLENKTGRCTRRQLEALPRGSFDLIVQEPLDPRCPQSGPVLTREHFVLLRELVAEGGGVMLWLPLDRMRWETLGLIARSFRSVFTSLTLWLAHPLDAEVVVGLFGRDLTEPVSWDRIGEEVAESAGQELRERYDLARPLDLLARYLGDDYTIGDRFQGQAIARDSCPLVEAAEIFRFEADADTSFNNVPQLLDAKESFVGRLVFGEIPAIEARGLEQRVGSAGTVLREVALAENLLARSERMRRGPVALDETPELVEGRAVVRLWRALEGDPSSVMAHRVMVRFLGLLMARGDPRAAAQVSMKMLDEIVPDDPRYLNTLGIAMLAQDKDDEKAAATLRKAVEGDPDEMAYQANLGVALVFAGHGEEAIDTLRRAKAARGTLWPLSEGLLAYLEGDVEKARRWLAPMVGHPPWGARLEPFVAR